MKNRILELRKSRNLTQKELGKRFGLAESTISQYENGNRQPDYEILSKLADYFSVSTDYLLGRDEQKEKPTVKDDGLSDDQKYLIAAIQDMSPSDIRKLRIIVEEVISPQAQ